MVAMSNIVGTVVKLLFASLIVGIILKFMNLDAVGFLRWIAASFGNIAAFFGDAFEWAIGPIMVGAVLVLPIWLIAFLVGKAKGRG